MTATEIHELLTSNPNTSTLRSAVKAEGLPTGSLTKSGLEAVLLDLMVERRSS